MKKKVTKETNRRAERKRQLRDDIDGLKERIGDLDSEIEAKESKSRELTETIEAQQNEYGAKCREFSELFKQVRPDKPTLSFPTGESVHVAVFDVPQKPLMPLLNYLHETLWKFKLKHVNIGCIAMNSEMALALWGQNYPSLTYATYPVVITQAIAKKQILVFSTFYAG